MSAGRVVNPGRSPPAVGRILGLPVTERWCARDELARNAGGTPGCGTADGAVRRTRGTQTGVPTVPAGRACRRPACGAPDEREAAPAPAVSVRTRNACTRARTHRTGSLAPRPGLCRALAARAAACPMRSCVHGKAARSPVGTTRSPGEAAQNNPMRHRRLPSWHPLPVVTRRPFPGPASLPGALAGGFRASRAASGPSSSSSVGEMPRLRCQRAAAGLIVRWTRPAPPRPSAAPPCPRYQPEPR
jgi:hypothetical protein